MPAKIIWTADSDATLRQMRAGGANWDRVAAVFGISRWSAIAHGRRIGAQAPPRPVPPPSDPTREALPPGHPASWNALTAGTLLEGTPYPWPPLGYGL